MLRPEDYPYHPDEYCTQEAADILGITLEEMRDLYDEVVLARKLWMEDMLDLEMKQMKEDRAKRKEC